jgi:tetratricopeptide (TPR) repeat protein
MNLRKVATAIPGFRHLLPMGWAWTLQEMTERIAERARCCARLHFIPAGCPTWEHKETYKSWVRLARRFLAINPDNAEAWVVLAHSSYHLDQREFAAKCYRVAAKLKNDPATWASLGSATNRIDEAVQAYRNALQHDPNDPWVWQELGNALSEDGKHAEAITCLEKSIALTQDPESKTWALCDLALVFIRLAKHDQATRALEDSLRLHHGPNSAFGHMYPHVADACQGAPDFAAALADRLRAIDEALSMSFVRYYSGRAAAYAQAVKRQD